MKTYNKCEVIEEFSITWGSHGAMRIFRKGEVLSCKPIVNNNQNVVIYADIGNWNVMEINIKRRYVRPR